MKKLIISIFVLCFISLQSYAQEIDFSQFHNYSLTVGELNSTDLDFGPVVTNSGNYSVGINNAKVISITGVKYLDVTVEVTGDNNLYLNGNPGYSGDSQRSIPFTLQAAYANNKGIPTISQAKFITNISSNSFLERLPILERQNQPPGPPPPPPTSAFDQSQVEETTYLYLYGSINVGNINVGSYSSQITVTINYD